MGTHNKHGQPVGQLPGRPHNNDMGTARAVVGNGRAADTRQLRPQVGKHGRKGRNAFCCWPLAIGILSHYFVDIVQTFMFGSVLHQQTLHARADQVFIRSVCKTRPERGLHVSCHATISCEVPPCRWASACYALGVARNSCMRDDKPRTNFRTPLIRLLRVSCLRPGSLLSPSRASPVRFRRPGFRLSPGDSVALTAQPLTLTHESHMQIWGSRPHFCRPPRIVAASRGKSNARRVDRSISFGGEMVICYEMEAPSSPCTTVAADDDRFGVSVGGLGCVGASRCADGGLGTRPGRHFVASDLGRRFGVCTARKTSNNPMCRAMPQLVVRVTPLRCWRRLRRLA